MGHASRGGRRFHRLLGICEFELYEERGMSLDLGMALIMEVTAA